MPWPTLNTPCQSILEDNVELVNTVEIAAGLTSEQAAFLNFVQESMCGALGDRVDEVTTAYATIDDVYASQNALELVFVLNRPDLMMANPSWWQTTELFVQERHDYIFSLWEEEIAAGNWPFPCSAGQPLCYEAVLETFDCEVPAVCFDANPSLQEELDKADAMSDEITFQNNFLNFIYDNL